MIGDPLEFVELEVEGPAKAFSISGERALDAIRGGNRLGCLGEGGVEPMRVDVDDSVDDDELEDEGSISVDMIGMADLFALKTQSDGIQRSCGVVTI